MFGVHVPKANAVTPIAVPVPSTMSEPEWATDIGVLLKGTVIGISNEVTVVPDPVPKA